jgi:hypothetical protein
MTYVLLLAILVMPTAVLAAPFQPEDIFPASANLPAEFVHDPALDERAETGTGTRLIRRYTNDSSKLEILVFVADWTPRGPTEAALDLFDDLQLVMTDLGLIGDDRTINGERALWTAAGWSQNEYVHVYLYQRNDVMFGVSLLDASEVNRAELVASIGETMHENVSRNNRGINY